MANSRIRAFVMDELKPLLPSTWRFVPYSTSLDTVSQVTVMLHLDQVTRSPQAPNSHRLGDFVLTIIEPKTEPGRADDSLDDGLFDLLDALDGIKTLRWTEAKRAIFGDNPAYDLSIQAHFEKE